MTFPTTDLIDGNTAMLHAWSIADKIRDRRPDLADRLISTDTKPLVRLVLPDSRSVVCGPVQLGNVVNWVVATPDSDLETHIKHKFDTHTIDEIVNMMIAAYDELAVTPHI